MRKTVYCRFCGTPMYKFGHSWYGVKNKKKLYQKYYCPSCNAQYAPEYNIRRSKKKQDLPDIFCPQCGRKMYKYKKLKTKLRLRCSGYKDPVNPCKYKINYDIELKAIAKPKNKNNQQGLLQNFLNH